MNQLLAQAIDWTNLYFAIPGLDPAFRPDYDRGSASKIARIISLILPLLFILGGLLLLFNLVSAGFQMMSNANDEKAVAGARARITHAITGFVILFIAFWLMKILELILGVDLGF